jgi:hypothetical protein
MSIDFERTRWFLHQLSDDDTGSYKHYRSIYSLDPWIMSYGQIEHF